MLQSFLELVGFAPILIVILIALAVGGYLLYQKQIKPASRPTPNPVVAPVASNSADTTNWKTYTDTKYGFKFNYPDGWKIEEKNSHILFSENGPVGNSINLLSPYKTENEDPYLITISIINNTKLFSLTDAFNNFHKGDGNKIENNKNIKLNSENGQLAQIEQDGLFNFFIQLKNNVYFEIAYLNPKYIDFNSRFNASSEIDQIISTFKFLP